MMRVLIATNVREQKGLARDAEILSDLLVGWGHLVETFDFRAEPKASGYDLTLHLEHVDSRHLDRAPRNWYVPNAEWHVGEAPAALKAGRFERVLCKTKQAERVFSPLTPLAVFVGFESRDRMLADVARERVFFHAPGQSEFRGTSAVLGAVEAGIGAAIMFPRAMPDAEYRREQNRCLFHLCPSELEGWGHTIHEALSVGALVITTDGPPMSEIDGTAYRIPTKQRDPFRLVERMIIDRKGVAAAATWCLGLSASEIEALRARSRAAFEAERADFRARLSALVNGEEIACVA